MLLLLLHSKATGLGLLLHRKAMCLGLLLLLLHPKANCLRYCKKGRLL